MNYREINTAILKARDVDQRLVKKDDVFYKYLFNNKVAYYYASELSRNKTEKEQEIIKRGNELNAKYIKTLKYVKKICDKHGIKFILFKTHKIIPEVVGGDIDLIVKRKDFKYFLHIFSGLGFESVEDEPGKGKCFKEGFNVIEPHITISWRGISYFNEKKIWRHTKEININNEKYIIFDNSMEVYIAIAQLFYEPEYIDLYTMIQLNNGDGLIGRIPNAAKVQKFINENKKKYEQIFPIFAPVGLFADIWTRELFTSKNIKVYVLHWIFYIYWRMRYKFIKKLPFTYIW